MRDAWASGQIRSEQPRAGAPSSPENWPSLPEHSTPTALPAQSHLQSPAQSPQRSPLPRQLENPLPIPSTVATGEQLSTRPRCSTACRFRRRIGRGEYGACPARDGGVG